jgi:hypothetical protein
VTRFTATSDDEAATSDAITAENRALMNERWMEQLQSTEIQQVRLEMVEKYVELGKTYVEAEVEVDKFLSDPEQSLQYLEMRRYAKSQELVGPELLVQLGGAFALGLFATVGAKHFGVSTNWLHKLEIPSFFSHFVSLVLFSADEWTVLDSYRYASESGRPHL